MSWPETMQRLWKHVKGSPAEVIRSFPVPADRVYDSGAFPERIEPRQSYFSIIMNEMFLCDGRQWLDLWDPMALVVTEFTYDGKSTAIPFVVGPSLLKLKKQDVPNGIALTDTCVAGLHPYTGGAFAVTIILARVKRASYARRVLEFLENVASAVPAGATLKPHLQVAGAVLDGVDALLGMQGDTQSLAGHRWEYDAGRTPWLRPGFFAMLNTDERNVQPTELSVVKGRLCDGRGRDAPGFRRTDFLLYSLCTTAERSDYTSLPFYELFKKALALAASGETGSWDRAKAALVTLYQEMITGSDLIFADAQRLLGGFKDQLIQARKDVESLRELGPADKLAAQAALSRGLGLQSSDSEGRARFAELAGTDALMRL